MPRNTSFRSIERPSGGCVPRTVIDPLVATNAIRVPCPVRQIIPWK
jgi:hypothetical protein